MSRQPQNSPETEAALGSLSALDLDRDAEKAHNCEPGDDRHAEPALPPEIMEAILALLPQPTLSACLRVNSTVYSIALPLLYRRIAIPPIPAGTLPHDVRDAHAPKPHGALRGPHPQDLASSLRLGHGRGTGALPSRRVDPLTLVRELVIPAHDPSPHCTPLSLHLRRLHLVLGANSSEIHRTQTNASVTDLLQRGQARSAGICPLLSRLVVDTLVIHRVGLLYARLRHILPLHLQPSRVVLLIPPDRATAGSAVKFEYPWAGGAGVLAFLEPFKATVQVDIVFDCGEHEKWRPIPRPKDGDVDGVPCWVTRFVRALARGVGSRKVRVVNLQATLEDPEDTACMDSVVDMARAIACDNGCVELEFVRLAEWRAEGVAGELW